MKLEKGKLHNDFADVNKYNSCSLAKHNQYVNRITYYKIVKQNQTTKRPQEYFVSSYLDDLFDRA